MDFTPGTRLGPYELVARIGAGGMGEVFKARDTRLNRSVAIKVLTGAFERDEQLKRRFKREATAISQLNHPHICTLYDIGDEAGTSFLIMELVDGETLADRVARGPLPVAEVLRFGAQVAEALGRAHAAGVVHRDLKPGNIMITKSGPKLLDFGLAKGTAIETEGDGATQQKPLTEEGTILGTLQYMAPEQLEAGDTDARTDIYALGAVLYEMATGRAPFAASSKASLIAAILKDEPPNVSAIQPLTPVSLDRIITRCLRKDPDDRWQNARDVAFELAAARDEPPAGVVMTTRRLWPVVAGLFAGAAIAAALILNVRRAPERPPIVRAFILPPPDAYFVSSTFLDPSNFAGRMALAPNGRGMVFTAALLGKTASLWIRDLAASEARPLAGTEGPSYPFWSADSEWVGFFADGKLKKISVGSASGAPETICAAPRSRGGTWNADNVIVFSPVSRGALHRVSADGGSRPVPLTTLDVKRNEFNHRWPFFLPDNDHFLYLAQRADASGSAIDGDIRVSSLSEPEKSESVVAANSNMVYANGRLLFCRDRSVIAQPFDTRRMKLSGTSRVVAQNVIYYVATANAIFSESDNGVLAYQAASDQATMQLARVSRDGTEQSTIGPPGVFSGLDLSPDGNKVAVDLVDFRSGTQDIWIYDAPRHVQTRVTFGPSWNAFPLWSPDQAYILFRSARTGPVDIFRKSAAGRGAEELLLTSASIKFPCDYSSDGRYIAYAAFESQKNTNFDIWIYSVAERRATLFLQSPFNDLDARFSPDGRWLAYSSDESGRLEVYVRGFPSGAPQVQISNGGGNSPRWRGDSQELFYMSGDLQIMSANARNLPDLTIPQPLFTVKPTGGGSPTYDVSADGRSFVVARPSGTQSVSPITIVINWTSQLDKRDTAVR